MTPDRILEKLAEGVRLAEEALAEGTQPSPPMLAQSRFNAHCNPEFVLELAREVEAVAAALASYDGVMEQAIEELSAHAKQLSGWQSEPLDDAVSVMRHTRRRYAQRVAALANPAAEEGACKHDWVDMRNEVITSGEWCQKCNAIRPGPAAEEEA